MLFRSIKARRTDGENTFRSALDADRVVAMILADGASASGASGSSGITPVGGVATQQAAPKGFFARLRG